MARKRVHTRWNSDLLMVVSGQLTFAELEVRHSALLRLIVKPWLSRVPAAIGLEDLYQEALQRLWRSIGEWKLEKGAPIGVFCKRQIKWHLRRFTHTYVQQSEKFARYIDQVYVEERVIFLPMSNQSVPVVFCDFTTDRDVVALVHYVIGSLPARQAQIIAGICAGQSLGKVAECVYGRDYRHPRRLAARAVSAAHQLVESWQTLSEPERRIYVADVEKQCRQLKPVRSVKPHAGQRQQTAAG